MPNVASRIPDAHGASGIASSAPEAAPRISSRELLGQRRDVVILHNGREYRLRETQNGKLILTA